MKILQIGNFEPEHSTENHLHRALVNNGHEVLTVQENDAHWWSVLSADPEGPKAWDLVLWTRTHGFWAHHPELSVDQGRLLQTRFLLLAHRAGVPVIAYHLDIWWGLKREHQVFEEPYFQCDLVVTADGGHEQKWLDAGVNHHWMPPAVSLAETELGMYRSDLASPLAFVGSWDGGYHPESAHRHELVRWLKQNFTRDCAFWPRPGEHALRGAPLRDLYQSVDVVVGDSCFVGTGLANYWSDRIPETIGRGGFLLHPMVDGLVEQGFTSETMATWEAFDWDALGIQIEWALSHPDERKEIARHGREVVLQHHTYEVRMKQLAYELHDRKLLTAEQIGLGTPTKKPRTTKGTPK